MAEKFGGYLLLERIGVGGMAEVFLARHSGLAGFEKEIVIKRIRPHLSEVPSFVNMFLGEAKLAAQLTHPHIVQIYDLGKIKDSYFIAMEHVPGRDLSVIIPKLSRLGIPFPVEYALKVGSNVCEALTYAHTKSNGYGKSLNIVHRDVSPENIRVAWTGTVKVLDFGIAKASTQLHETKAGEIKGKLSYMSPEQVMGKDLDHRSDIFSLGAVLYECLTGVKLFAGENDLAIMNNIVEGKIYPPSYFREDIPQAVESIVMKALTKDRRKRYDSTANMQFDIDSFLASHEFTPTNVHLSNFIKQIFEKERVDEQDRRRRKRKEPEVLEDEATPSLVVDFSDINTVYSPPRPPLIRDESAVEEPAESSDPAVAQSISVSLEGSDMKRLEAAASRNQLSPGELLSGLVKDFLKYQK